MPASAEFSSTFQAVYEFPVNDTFDMFIEGNVYHRSGINFSINGAPSAQIGAATLLGASIGVQAGDVRASLFCKNCLDERVPEGIGLWAGDAANSSLETASQVLNDNSVRNIGVSLRYEF